MAQQHQMRLDSPDDRSDQRFRCSCGFVSDWRDSKAEVEEDASDHLAEVERLTLNPGT